MVTLAKSNSREDYASIESRGYRDPSIAFNLTRYRILNGYRKDSTVGEVISDLTSKFRVNKRLDNVEAKLTALESVDLGTDKKRIYEGILNVLRLSEKGYQKRKSQHANRVRSIIDSIQSKLSPQSDLSDYVMPIEEVLTPSTPVVARLRQDYPLPIITYSQRVPIVLTSLTANTTLDSKPNPSIFEGVNLQSPKHESIRAPKEIKPLNPRQKSKADERRFWENVGLGAAAAIGLVAGGSFIGPRVVPPVYRLLADAFEKSTYNGASLSAIPDSPKIVSVEERPSFTLSETMQSLLTNQKPAYKHPFEVNPPRTAPVSFDLTPDNPLSIVRGIPSVQSRLFGQRPFLFEARGTYVNDFPLDNSFINTKVEVKPDTLENQFILLNTSEIPVSISTNNNQENNLLQPPFTNSSLEQVLTGFNIYPKVDAHQYPQ